MKSNFKKELLKETRNLLIDKYKPNINDDDMLKAITVSQELEQYGFILRPEDIVRLAHYDSAAALQTVRETYTDIKAKPMYPDFPNQVMNMDEAVYRFHQMVHYFTTYGVEMFTGAEVSKGWLPEMPETAKTIVDDRLVDLKMLHLVDEKEAYRVVESIVAKKERWTLPEKNLIVSSLEKLNSTEVPFKENITTVAEKVWDNSEKLKLVLKKFCQHPGDVLDTTHNIIEKQRKEYGISRLKTSQKRAIVSVLESYPAYSFAENLALKRERNLHLLNQLSYTGKYGMSKSSSHENAVKQLRNKELRTWNSKLEEKIRNKETDALDFFAERPGLMLRSAGHLLRNGYNKDDILDKLIDKDFKFQTLVDLTSKFSRSKEGVNSLSFNSNRSEKEIEEIYKISRTLLNEAMQKLDTPLANKKVYIEKGQYNFENSNIETNGKSNEGGYIRSGLAFNIPEESKNIRFFCYWNHPSRVDVDLHAFALDKNEDEIHIGWNSDFNKNGIASSGDITHSDAAEYIDINIEKAKETGIKHIVAEIHSYTGIPFKEIEEIFTGIMPVKKLKENVKLYNNQSLLFRHDLMDNKDLMNYSIINIENGYIKLLGEDYQDYRFKASVPEFPTYTLQTYVDDLIKAQNAIIVESPEEADVVLRLDKAQNDKEISLLDANLFMDSKVKERIVEEIAEESLKEQQLDIEL